jgi:hypothetical protein
VSTIVIRHRRWAVAALVALLAIGTSIATHRWRSTSATLPGRQVTGSGASSDPRGGSEGAGTGEEAGGNGNKSFVIHGAVDGLYPGGNMRLHLTLTNPGDQPMVVTALSAALASTAATLDNTCSADMTIGAWTNSTRFELPRNAVDYPVPGYIPVSLAHSAPDRCQGNTFPLHYAGTAVQK